MSSILFYSTRKSKIFRKIFFSKKHTQKSGPGGALKGGHFRNCQHFCRSCRGFVAKHQKIEGEKNFYFRKKISQCRIKTERGDTLGFSIIHSVAKQQKQMKGGPFEQKKFPEKKSRSAEKNWKGVWYVTRENRKNFSGSVR